MSAFDTDAFKALQRIWNAKLAKEGLAVLEPEGSDPFVGRSRKLLKWAKERGIHLPQDAGEWTFTADYYSKAQRVLTYWPYKQDRFYHCLRLSLELPCDKGSLLSAIRVGLPGKKPSVMTISRTMRALDVWVQYFDFEGITEWGPGTLCPNPITYLIQRDHLPSLQHTYTKMRKA